MENQKNYSKVFLGLDIGTDSVGWAVTDDSYRLKKCKGQLMWGVQLFDEAESAAQRRSFRTSRRRLDRRQQRVKLLQDIFAPEILPIDEKFFLRLKESALLPEDSEHRTGNIYFDDPDYGDKEYFEEYPTIHHLIKELMKDKQPHDVRLVYYACAYLVAHRGHFLFSVDKDNVEKITDFAPVYDDFYAALDDLCGTVPFDKNPADFERIVRKHIAVNNKQKELNTLFFGNSNLKDMDSEMLDFKLLTKFISGGTVKLSKLFFNEEYEGLEKNSVCVKNADFSDTLELLAGQIDELHLALVSKVKAIYDWSLLVDILKGSERISEAKVDIYEQHKQDLKELKQIAKKYLSKEEYNEIFREISDKKNYVSYVYNAPSGKRTEKYKRGNPEEFCKFVKKYLEKITPDEGDKATLESLIKKCEDLTLCPRQVTGDNRVIPYQLYYYELKKILENAGEYLSFLNERDEYGSNADKILKIMEFRIPYYAGPLVSKDKSQNAWLRRKKEGRIYPWNFDELVDKDASENEFIRRMTVRCSYLAGEDVLPKSSLLYSKYCVLNEINNIQVDEKPISVELKQQLYRDKFENSRQRLTKKRIKEYFISKGFYSGDIVITGIDEQVQATLQSYHDFKGCLERGDLDAQAVEEIIERITVTNDTGRLKRWLKSNYPQLSGEEVSRISKLKYKDYGRMSRKFLEGMAVDVFTGEVLEQKSIIQMLWETNENLMQLLSSKYKYTTACDLYEKYYYDQPEHHLTVADRLKEMYVPIGVHRSVLRTLEIVKELKSLLKTEPDKIFIEMARGTEENLKGTRTQSRREQIEKLLSDKSITESGELKEKLASVDDGKLRSEKYFLYFMQLGKCLYTGKTISFEDLENNNIWNIDHIWPQSKIKDDSLDNKVLVDSRANADKGDDYPIKSEIRDNMRGLWTTLYQKGFMSEKKYQRLIRSTRFTDEELSGFIARQLVETRQSTKAVATLLKELFPQTEIVYVKARLASDLRQEMDMLKCRDINDLHHAKDAYLNIVVGNVYDTKFTKNPLNFINSGEKYTIKLFQKSSDGKEKGILTRKVERNGVVAWKPETCFKTVRDMMAKNSIRYVRYSYKRKGGLFDQMPMRKGEGLVPRKKGLDSEKYGGYRKTTATCFSLVKCGKDVVIMAVELMYADKFFSDVNFARQYAAGEMSRMFKKDISPESISYPLGKRVIKINTLIEIDGCRCNIQGKSGNRIIISLAESLIVDKQSYDYIKKISSYVEKISKNTSCLLSKEFTVEKNLKLFDLFVSKMQNKPYSVMLLDMYQKVSSRREIFSKLDIADQVIALHRIMSLMKTGRSGGCDLTLIGEAKNAGVLMINSNLSKLKGYTTIRIIDQSVTGLYEKKSENLKEL